MIIVENLSILKMDFQNLCYLKAITDKINALLSVLFQSCKWANKYRTEPGPNLKSDLKPKLGLKKLES